MSSECKTVHNVAWELERHEFPFDKSKIPLNGIYLLFQRGEEGHNGERIVRVGTHTGDNRLRSRLKQHFINPNKDRSIFRKNIGRALLNQCNDPFMEYWELDLTTKKAKEKYLPLVDINYQKTVEDKVCKFIQTNFSFCVIEVNDKEERLQIESGLISTISWCDECKSSKTWLGNASPKRKIVKSGLWLINELYKTPLNSSEVEHLSRLMKGEKMKD